MLHLVTNFHKRRRARSPARRLTVCALAWATVTGAALHADTNASPSLFTLRDGWPCHTADYVPHRLDWNPAPAPPGLRAVFPHPVMAATVYGIADDPPAVLPTLGYPDGAARRQACDAIAGKLGDNAAASLQRARACFYAGAPRLDLAHCADALRRCQASAVPEIARAVLHGFRAVRGTNAGLDDVATFIVCGTNGPDGLAGTADDLPDPFAPLGLAGASRQPGGLTPVPAEALAQVQVILLQLRELAARPGNPSRRVVAIQAYQRTCEALVVVDHPATLAWVLDDMRHEPDNRVLGALARLGQTVAKADQLNLTDLRQFDRDTLRVFEQMQRPVPNDVLEAQRQTDGTLLELIKKPPERKR